MSEQSTSSFLSKLEARVKGVNSLLCIGLDPHGKELASAMGKEYPSEYNNELSQEDKCDAAFTFCKTIIDATIPYAACYKPNAAFFEALGSDLGNTTLARVLREIPAEIPILLDVKRGDIGSTASAYAEACYDHLGGRVDAVTLSPLMGWDSVGPFVSGKYSNKGAFLLCKTSNPGSNEILALKLADGQTVYERIAKLSLDWSKKPEDGTSATLGLVVGATDSTALSNARAAAGEGVWILAPGVGAQGGNLEEACRSGMNQQGSCMLIPVSRGISQAADPQAAAKELCEQINAVRAKIQSGSKSNSSSNNSSGDDSIAPYQKEFLEFSLSEGVLKFGSFVLKSGRTSPYFFNAGLFADGAALFKLGKAYASAIMASPEL